MNQPIDPLNSSQKDPVEAFQNEISLFLKRLPNLPGVYQHLDAQGQILYVGKAKNLKKRVSQYFQKNINNPRIALMISKIANIQYTVTRSEAEALILENNLIKEHHPRFNILFRDDKSYPYLMFSQDPFPRIAYYRGSTQKNAFFFGPYPNSWAVKETIQILQKVFQLRTCENAVFKNRSRPCLLGQIKRCSAPCIEQISLEHYQEDVQKATRFLRGDCDQLIKELELAMQDSAEQWDFEQASIYRDQIQALSKIRHQQSMEHTGSKDFCDILAVDHIGQQYVVNLSMVREGLYLGDKAFFPKHTLHNTPQDVMNAFMTQHYLEHPIPDLLILSHEPTDPNIIHLLAQEKENHKKIRITLHPKGIHKSWLEITQKNAKIALENLVQKENIQINRTLALAHILEMDTHPEALDRLKIECFDISHMSGEATQASCVVYEQHEMNHSAYRRFNIQDITPGDDYAAMRQVLTRRYARVLEENKPMPDIVLVDGGKGQLQCAIDVFNELGLSLDPLMGIAKGEGRKVGLETLIFATDRSPLQLGVGSEALMLLAMIRDEAHRFAITGMRKKRDKARKKSKLEDIPGIGPKRRQKLLNRFGGLSKVANASIEDLCQVEGISPKLAKEIYERLH